MGQDTRSHGELFLIPISIEQEFNNDFLLEEDKKKPLTDDKLADILKSKGYPIARRTIAKYREQLDVPVARLRKKI